MLGMESVAGFCNLTLHQSLVAALTLRSRVPLQSGEVGGMQSSSSLPVQLKLLDKL